MAVTALRGGAYLQALAAADAGVAYDAGAYAYPAVAAGASAREGEDAGLCLRGRGLQHSQTVHGMREYGAERRAPCASPQSPMSAPNFALATEQRGFQDSQSTLSSFDVIGRRLWDGLAADPPQSAGSRTLSIPLEKCSSLGLLFVNGIAILIQLIHEAEVVEFARRW